MKEERHAITLFSGNQKLFGILHLPEKARQEKVPSLLFCPGLGGNKSGKYRLFVRLAEQLAKAGIAALRFDYRGSGDSEGDFEETTVASLVEDATLCAHFLLNHPAIDPERFGLLGRSFGAAIAILTAKKLPQTRALALIAPFFDVSPWLAFTKTKTGEVDLSQQDGKVRFAGHELSKDCLDQMVKLDIAKALESLSELPMLLVQGLKDTVLGMYHFERYSACRKASSVETEILQLANSDHEMSYYEERELLLHKTCDWLVKQLH